MIYKCINLTTKWVVPFDFKTKKSAEEFLKPYRNGYDYFLIAQTIENRRL